ncbi:MAG: hypothetical protein RIS75_969 [Actinomycetota bacterium]
MPAPMTHTLSTTALSAFLETYHRHTPRQDLAHREPADVKAAVISHLNLGATRTPGTAAIRVLTPHAEIDGWESRHSVVQVVMDDMPFVIDSLTAALMRQTRGVYRVVHPIMYAERDAQGQLISVSESNTNGNAESWSEFEINRLLTPAAHDELKDFLGEVIEDIASANRDWLAMRGKAQELAKLWGENPPAVTSVEIAQETSEFLTWLTDNHLTFLGYRYYNLDQKTRILTSDDATGLGLFAGQGSSQLQLGELNEESQKLAVDAQPLILTKSSTRSSVHRPVYMDYFGVKQFGADGKVVGEHRFLGLLSREAYTDSVLEIPVIRTTAQKVLDDSGLIAGSHSYKDLLQFIESFPRDEMLQVNAEWLSQIAEQALTNLDRRQTQAFLHTDIWGRFASVFVYIPRDVYNTDVRHGIENLLLQKFAATEVETTAHISESALARLHFRVRLSGTVSQAREIWSDVLKDIDELTHSWEDDFAEMVVNHSQSDQSAADFLKRWSNAFGESYTSSYSVSDAFADALQIEAGEGLQVRIVAGDEHHRIRIFNPVTAIRLSSLLPVLAAFGLDVEDERPHQLFPHEHDTVWLHDLGFSTSCELDAQWSARLNEAFREVQAGRAEIDSLLQLVISAQLTGRQVSVLRTYAAYVSQWGIFNASTVMESLTSNPALAKKIVHLFETRFDPALTDHSIENISQELHTALDAVASLEHDRILRAITEAVTCTVRTNAYQIAADGKLTSTIAIKIAASTMTLLPNPRPFAEIWVESPRVRGVHLRFGSVARGGLRWSDRRDDMRTEVMGLVRAQVVKNAVIVPTGAKGGFFGKQLPDASAREQWLAAGIAAYQEFINALLDVTDNRVEGGIVPPQNCVRHDGDDPYLVVAADKGTATFSDIANKIAVDRGFWLGDAFASGGSVGYDHKAMGITARGAWESVRHHFELLGLNPEADNITVVGVGDMSGDVFGNGMLLSQSMKLVAAFDHRHIFLDPHPQPEQSWKERKRLFELPRSSWADYDTTLISEGGGVFARSEKTIPLSAEIRSVLGISEDVASLAPNELMSAILKAPVDLLWNGGIGTYVKAESQSHAEVGDKANDALRINGSQLRCRVVGEGGNLGFTQLGRIEAALNNVSINTDAIDNSAGVDTSDHEVNLKILLSLRTSADFTTEKRNQLLASLTDDVGHQVLDDNIYQNELLTVALAQAYSMAPVHQRMMRDWQKQGILDRNLENLPSDQTLAHRMEQGIGLTKPELSVLVAHAKISLTESLLQGTAIDEPWSEKYLLEYFPSAIRTEFKTEILNHPLRREIAATVIANSIINRGGITTVWRSVEESGAAIDDIVKAIVIAIDAGQLETLYQKVDELGPDKWSIRIDLLKEIRRYIDRVSRWLVTNRASNLDVARDVERFGSATSLVRNNLKSDLRGHELERWTKQAQGYVERGVSVEMAQSIAGLLDEYAAFDLAELAASHGVTLAEWSQTYFAISDELGGDMLLSTISALSRDDRWQTMARAALRADMYAVLAAVTEKVLLSSLNSTFEDRLADWLSTQSVGISRVKDLLSEIEHRTDVDIAAISVALRTLRSLVTQTAASQ